MTVQISESRAERGTDSQGGPRELKVAQGTLIQIAREVARLPTTVPLTFGPSAHFPPDEQASGHLCRPCCRSLLCPVRSLDSHTTPLSPCREGSGSPLPSFHHSGFSGKFLLSTAPTRHWLNSECFSKSLGKLLRAKATGCVFLLPRGR